MSTTDIANGYRALTEEVGAVELARDVVEVSGPEAAVWLQGQLSQDVENLRVGDARLALLLEPQGRVTALLRVTRVDGDRYLLDTDAGTGAAVAERLNRFKLRTKAEVTPLAGWRCVGVRGPAADRAEGGTGVRAASGWPALPGWDLLGPEAAAPGGVPLCPAEAWEAVRVEAGLPRMGAEVGERTIPAEIGVLDAAVDFTKGCYTGQELVARMDARGNQAPRRLRGVLLGAAVPVRSPLLAGDREVGTVTSVAESPALGTVGLALVRREVDPPAELSAAADGTPVRADVRALPLKPA